MTEQTALAKAESRAELIRAETQDGEEHAFDFQATRIKLPSGGLKVFTTSDGSTMDPFTGIVAVSQKARAYWPEDDAQGLPPLCASADGVNGWLNDAAPDEQIRADQVRTSRHPGVERWPEWMGPHSCNRCPLNAWGSGDGRGKACKELRRLLVLVDGWAMPAVMTLPPTSTKAFDMFASARASKGESYFSCRTRFELDQKRSGGGVTYSAIKLSVAEELPEDELGNVLALRAQFAELVRNAELTQDEYDTAF